MSPAWEDLDQFFDPDDFADLAVITYQDGGTKNVYGNFDDPYMNAQTGEYEMDSSAPRFTCKFSAVADVRRGDTVRVCGGGYDVLSGAQPDGTGMALLALAPR